MLELIPRKVLCLIQAYVDMITPTIPQHALNQTLPWIVTDIRLKNATRDWIRIIPTIDRTSVLQQDLD